ncbi:CPXCG motif-containing cysteine-rich protein [Catenovulum maritimum]|uniref:Zn-ribbon protein n=1 Tax=Catenovulum maritimum TaxID=1513271 RepID=A0A0J8GX29_9ALTE|nr:CPXCG motif-containing cysteine-rich protein [Catenovulum maritimum]KMT65263.1 Zn-ribbon protein [Catenovulum maritimum]
MNLKDQSTECPHCGHHIHVILDDSNGDQDYFEDCPACCNAIHIMFHLNESAEKLEFQIQAE